MGTEATMSGALVLSHRTILTELCGSEGFERVLAGLSPAERQLYVEASPIHWVPVAIAEKAFVLAAAELGREVAELHETVSRRSVEHTLTTLWRFMLRFVSDEALIARSTRIYSRAFQRGTLAPTIIDRGQAEIRVHGWPDMPEFSIRGLRIAIETVLSLAGREGARLVLRRTPEGPMFIATWRA